MPLTSADSVVDALRKAPLLDDEQLAAVSTELQAKHENVRDLLKELIKRRWLTNYQAQKVLNGQVEELMIGSYLLLSRLGEGGMGQVYKAKNLKNNWTVALKLIRADRLSNPTVLRRFRREAKLMDQLSHPNVVNLYSAEKAGDTCFLVMEYVQGKDLARIVREKGALSIRIACACIRQAAEGLDYAHEKGLVHRDVKPHNLLLTPEGRVKVLDLGIARFLDTAADGDTTALTLTQEGTVVGTVDYLSPEQARNAHVADRRSDLYSLGCTFYQLLTGAPPFPGDSAIDKLMKHQTEDPAPVTKLRPDVPESIAALVQKLMAKNPDDRCQTAQEVVDWLKGDASADRMMEDLVEVESVEDAAIFLDESALLPEANFTNTIPMATAVPVPTARRARAPGVGKWLWPTVACVVGVLGIVILILAMGGDDDPERDGDDREEKTDRDDKKQPNAQASGFSWRYLPATTSTMLAVDLTKFRGQSREAKAALSEALPELFENGELNGWLKEERIERALLAVGADNATPLWLMQGRRVSEVIPGLARHADQGKGAIVFDPQSKTFTTLLDLQTLANCPDKALLLRLRENARDKEADSPRTEIWRDLEKRSQGAFLLLAMHRESIRPLLQQVAMPNRFPKQLARRVNVLTAAVTLDHGIDAQVELRFSAGREIDVARERLESFVDVARASPGPLVFFNRDLIPLIPLVQESKVTSDDSSVSVRCKIAINAYLSDVRTLRERPFQLVKPRLQR